MRRRPERLAEGEQNREISPKYLTYEHMFAILIPTAAFSFRRPWRRGKTAPVQQSLQRGGGHMPQDKWSAVTHCPYYRKHTEVTISCEGPANQSRLTLEFASRAQREHYQEKTCACYLYRACPLALAASRKYDDGGNLREPNGRPLRRRHHAGGATARQVQR